jgi:ligand-binding sensor domain-containing protein
LLALNIANSLHGQQSTNYQYYGVENGLPTNLIKCLIQDKKGFIWIGTPNGLVRFDGRTFLNPDSALEKC